MVNWAIRAASLGVPDSWNELRQEDANGLAASPAFVREAPREMLERVLEANSEPCKRSGTIWSIYHGRAADIINRLPSFDLALALREIKRTGQQGFRVGLYVSAAGRMEGNERDELIQLSLADLQHTPYGLYLAEFETLGPMLADEHLETVLTAIESGSNDYVIGRSIEMLARWIRPSSRLLSAARRIPPGAGRALALLGVARWSESPDEAVLREVLENARATESHVVQLLTLASEIPRAPRQILLDEALEQARQVSDPYFRVERSCIPLRQLTGARRSDAEAEILAYVQSLPIEQNLPPAFADMLGEISPRLVPEALATARRAHQLDRLLPRIERTDLSAALSSLRRLDPMETEGGMLSSLASRVASLGVVDDSIWRAILETTVRKGRQTLLGSDGLLDLMQHLGDDEALLRAAHWIALAGRR
jgi:ADP-ribose pyrophosphatase YjhB (NUDIX family)